MATGYYSKISNTVVSGNDLISSLSGKNVRDLEFASAVNNSDPVKLVASNASLSVAQLVQASTSRLLVDPTSMTASVSLLLGSDGVVQAQNYIQLFNLTSTNQNRLLTFTNTAAVPSALTINLTNDSAVTGGTYVKVALPVASSGLFRQSFASGAYGGANRQVLVSGTTLTSGSEVVTFTVLQAVNGLNAGTTSPT